MARASCLVLVFALAISACSTSRGVSNYGPFALAPPFPTRVVGDIVVQGAFSDVDVAEIVNRVELAQQTAILDEAQRQDSLWRAEYGADAGPSPRDSIPAPQPVGLITLPREIGARYSERRPDLSELPRDTALVRAGYAMGAVFVLVRSGRKWTVQSKGWFMI